MRRNGELATSAGQFFVDSLAETGMSELTLGVFLEEMHSTLYADLTLHEKTKKLSIAELCEKSPEEIQGLVNGHPKLLLNKGRMGFGATDLAKYSPEGGEAFRLFWLAVRGESVIVGGEKAPAALLAESLDENERARFAAAKPPFAGEGWHYLPTHPWQWDRVLRVQYAAEIAHAKIVPLGEFGDLYRPQISLRTLSNISRPGRADLKLPLSVLNTSAVRGISPRYIQKGPALAAGVQSLCRADQALATVEVLEDFAGLAYSHPLFHAVKGAPYRYHETLAAIWRQSPNRNSAEKALLTGALAHQDETGRPLLSALVERSGLSAEAWLREYFRVAVLPLYHLQVRYGLGLVAHGQNVVLRLREHRPVGIYLKDFQGDLRASSEENALRARALGAAEATLERLPPHYLIHDLITGHFVTVLRFVSGALEEGEGFPEANFYRVLAEEIALYLRETETKSVPAGIDLLAESFPRVLVNKVRFAIGYGDSAERPRPALGGELRNPMHFSSRINS